MQAGWNGLKVKCVITDASGNQIESDTAILNLAAIAITGQPADVSAAAGSPFSFTVSASGNGLTYDWKYQWPGQNSWISWANGKTETLTGTMQAGWNGLKVKCVITDANGNQIESDTVSLNLAAITITGQPADVSTAAGSTFTFTVAASGTGLTYDWKYQWPGQNQWISWNNGKTETLTGTMQAGWDGIKVKCIVSDGSGNVTESDVVTLSLNTSSAILQTGSYNAVAEYEPVLYEQDDEPAEDISEDSEEETESSVTETDGEDTEDSVTEITEEETEVPVTESTGEDAEGSMTESPEDETISTEQTGS